MTQANLMDRNVQIMAADWVARLSGDPAESDWLAFEAWLQASASHRAAYDKAIALWLDIDRQAQPLAAALAEGVRAPRRAPAVWWAAGVTAVAALAVTFAALHPYRAAETVYATAKGERRAITLSDGTHIALNSDSRISVRLERDRRAVTLAQGEAAFIVVHDAKRPFEVQAGDQILRDLGTEFDVLRASGRVQVTVRQGLVEALPTRAGGRSLSLGPGDRLEHQEGAARSMIVAVSADDAFAWRSGRLIYRNQPLGVIAADLNRYGEDQVRVEGPAANLRFSGVLTIGDQPAMVRRLTTLLPLSASRQDGVITLHGVDTTR
jgi:transmembrane sensor